MEVQYSQRRYGKKALLILFLVEILLAVMTGSDAAGVFPAVQALALGKPITTNASCTSQQFCSHVSPSWASRACSEVTCDDSCPGDTTLPQRVVLGQLPRTSTAASQTAGGPILFNGGYLRYAARDVPVFESSTGFSLSIQYLPTADVEVTLFSKVSSAPSNTVIFAVKVLLTQVPISSRVRIVYTPHGMTSSRTVTLQTSPYVRNSHYLHLTVSCLYPQVNVFANGSLLAAGLLSSPVANTSGDLFIGAESGDVSIPRFQGLARNDFSYYAAALSERSATELVTGKLRSVSPQSACRCSPLYPRLDSSDSLLCVHPILFTYNQTARINSQSFPPLYMNDGDLRTVWVSNLGQQLANVTMDLQGQFEIQTAVIWFLNPRARAAVLELSATGQDYRPIQYFSDDCVQDFQMPSNAPRRNVGDVNCKTSYLTNSLGYQGLSFNTDSYNSTHLLSTAELFQSNTSPSTLGRYLRIRLLDFNTSIGGQTDRYYGIAEVIVNGRCACNGHADVCTVNPVTGINTCQCQYNTEGDSCETCHQLYNDKPWMAGNSTSPNACLPCQCNGHAVSCVYNATLDSNPDQRTTGSGGQCTCRDNTAGAMCNQCARRYYRDVTKSLNNIAVCVPCGCDLAGVTDDGDCGKTGLTLGMCYCREHVGGRRCDTCSNTAYLNTTIGSCSPCNCSSAGAVNGSCDASGTCTCKSGFQGRLCDICTPGLTGIACDQCLQMYWSYNASTASCQPCSCATNTGATSNECDSLTGQCRCQPGFVGRDCSVCAATAGTQGPRCIVCRPGYYGFNGSFCSPCLCNGAGSTSQLCHNSSGQCSCVSPFSGRDCRQCIPEHGTAGTNCTMCRDGYFSFNGSHCMSCECNQAGASLAGCNTRGSCTCKTNVMGSKCTNCVPNTLGLASDNPLGCAAVDPLGIADLTQTSLRIRWQAPASGSIVSYSIFQDRDSGQASLRIHFTTDSGSGGHPVSGLMALTTYRYFIRACTAERCAESPVTSITTLSGVPTFQGQPAVSHRNGSTLVSWPEAETTARSDVAYNLQVIQPSFASPPQPRSVGIQFYTHGFAVLNISSHLKGDWTLDLSFRTFSPDSTLLYIYDKSAASFLLLRIINSQITLSVRIGSSGVDHVSNHDVNVSDGSLHAVSLNVSSSTGSIGMTIDTKHQNRIAVTQLVLFMPDITFIGGVSRDESGALTTAINSTTTGFVGCVSSLELNSVLLDLTLILQQSSGVGSAQFGCPSRQQQGVYFLGASSGYVRSSSNPIREGDGTNFTITLSFRTSYDSGLLMFASGASLQRDVVVYFSNSSLVALIGSGVGGGHVAITALSTLCDSEWHTVTVSKTLFTIMLSVDSMLSSASQLPASSSSVAYGNGDLYFGGLPSDLLQGRKSIFAAIPAQFSGCMKEYTVDDILLNIAEGEFIQLDGCPGSATASLPCTSSNALGAISNPRSVYLGSHTSALLQSGLLPPTADMAFQVVAMTNTGTVRSNWSVLQISDAAPSGLAAPSTRFSPPSSVLVAFSPASQGNGLILRYELLAYAVATFEIGFTPGQPSPSQPITTLALSPGVFSHVVGNLLASHRYEIRIRASTAGGRTESSGSFFTTPDAAPEGVMPPNVASINMTAVSVAWSSPMRPNGVLTVVTIFLNDSVVINSSDSSLRHTNISGLNTFTSYSIRLKVCNMAGCTSSNDTVFRTLAGVPQQLNPPIVHVLGDTSLEVRWTLPGLPNGFISGFEILTGSMQPFRLLQSATHSSRRSIVNDLLPNTVYFIRIRAVNQAGAATSNSTTVTTLEGAPTGIAQPVIQNIQPRSLVVTWGAPSTPNGVIAYYQVNRDGVLLFNLTSSSSFSAMDSGLTPFTSYSYSITACTSRLCATGNETIALTAEDIPSGLSAPSLATRSSTTFAASWSPPAAPNGMITYTLFVIGPGLLGNGMERNETRVTAGIAGVTTSVNVSGLLPYRSYQAVLMARTSAGGINSSFSQPTRTLQDAPSDVSNLTVIVTTSRSMSVSWKPPGRANGVVSQYRIRVIDVTRNQPAPLLVFNSTTHSAVVAGLLPYTVYQLHLETVTAGGSGVGPVVNATTLEDVPAGQSPPTVTNITSRGFQLSWLAPSLPNGIILRYEVVLDTPLGVRRFPTATLTRSFLIGSSNGIGLAPATTYSAWLSVCTAIGCGRSLSIAVTTLHDFPSGVSQPTFVRADASSLTVAWTRPRQPNGILLFYQADLYRAIDNSLLQSSVVNVTAMPMAAQSATFNGLKPSSSYTFLLEVTNTAGRALAPSLLVNTTDGTPANLTSPRLTDVTSSVIRVTWIKPAVPNGNIVSYTLYRNGSRIHSSTQTGSLNDTGLTPYTGYSYQLQVCTSFSCANSSTSTERTGEGVPDGIGQPTLVYLGQNQITITWPIPLQPNGVIQEYSIRRRLAASCCKVPGTTIDCTLNESCLGPATAIYTGGSVIRNVTLTEIGLQAYVQYAYNVVVRNGASNGTGNYSVVLTPEAVPSGLQQPRVVAKGENFISLAWNRPALPNGIIIGYQLLRNISSPTSFLSSVLFFNDTTSLTPFTAYAYLLSACTSAGCTTAMPIVVRTEQSSPSGVQAPKASVLSAYAIRVTWSQPSQPNGRIIAYRLMVLGTAIAPVKVGGEDFNTTVNGLMAFTSYAFTLQACTSAGCTASSISSPVRTLESPPEQMPSPLLSVMSSSSINVSWDQPAKPNGFIVRFDLTRNGSVIASLLHNITTFLDTGLKPFTAYIYSVEVYNSAGSLRSPAAVDATHQDTPSMLLPPAAMTINSSAFEIFLPVPLQPNGVLLNFSLFINGQAALALGQVQNATVPGFDPFSNYTFQVQVCTIAGCALSSSTSARTAEALAEINVGPNVTALGSTMVLVQWSLPYRPNGIISSYTVQRRLLSQQTVLSVAVTDAASFSLQDSGLIPFSDYEYRLRVTNGAGVSTSPWSHVQTLEDIPQGVTISSVIANQRSVIVSWPAPLLPRGVILRYEILLRIVGSGAPFRQTASTNNSLSLEARGLLPFTVYEFQLAAVNSAGRGLSAAVSAKTLEDRPESLEPITVVAAGLDGTWLNLSWMSPSMANGIITQYFVFDAAGRQEYTGRAMSFLFRRLRPFTTYYLLLRACTAIGCTDGRLQNFTTPQTAPSLQLPPTAIVIGSRSVNVTWTPPGQPNGILTFYAIFRLLSSNVTQDLVVTIDPEQSSSLHYTDTGLKPFTSYRYAVSSGGVGGNTTSVYSLPVITSSAPPENFNAPAITGKTSNMLAISWQAPAEVNGILSGYEVLRNGSVLSTLSTSVLSYTDRSLLAAQSYCYIVRVCTHLGGCTNSTTVCTVTSDAIPRGVRAPTLLAVNATTVSASWMPPAQPRGYIANYTLSITMPCVSALCVAFTGSLRSAVTHNLRPFTNYTFKLEACNSAGCATAPQVAVETPQAAPSRPSVPFVNILSSTSVNVLVTEPSSPNGIIQFYRVVQNGSIVATIQSPTVRNFTYLVMGLSAMTTYVFAVQSSTSAGTSESDSVVITTFPPPPMNVSAVNVTVLSSSGLYVEWEAAEETYVPNVYYLLSYDRNTPTINTTSMQVTLPGLRPFAGYTVNLQTCTVYGCTASDPVTVQTFEAPPTDLTGPTVAALDGYSVSIMWTAPISPNGLVTSYTVEKRLLGNLTAVVATSQPASAHLNFSDPVVKPITTYEYRVIAMNSVGSVTSPWVAVRTLEGIPSHIPPPDVRHVTQSRISATLLLPARPNGAISSFAIYVSSRAANITLENLNAVISGLEAFTSYELIASFCTQVGCGNSSGMVTQTAEGIPGPIDSPIVTSVAARSMTVRWTPPAKPNGRILRYTLYVTNVCPSLLVGSPTVCQVQTRMAYEGSDRTSFMVDGLTPFTRYFYSVSAINSVGKVDSVNNSQTITTSLTAAPEVINNVSYTTQSKSSGEAINVHLDWSATFVYNSGDFVRYIVLEDGETLAAIANISRTTFVAENRQLNRNYSYVISLTMSTFPEVTTYLRPVYVYETMTTTPSSTEGPSETEPEEVASAPVYKQAGFIVGMVILGLLVIIVIAIFLHRPGKKEGIIDEDDRSDGFTSYSPTDAVRSRSVSPTRSHVANRRSKAASEDFWGQGRSGYSAEGDNVRLVKAGRYGVNMYRSDDLDDYDGNVEEHQRPTSVDISDYYSGGASGGGYEGPPLKDTSI